MKAYALTTEHMTDPMGIDTPRPRMSWKCRGGIRQSAYQIRAAAHADDLETGKLLWDSHEVLSDENLNIEYGAKAGTGSRVYWQVRLKDECGEWGEWSGIAVFEMGLLRREDQTARWINPEKEYDPETEPPVSLLRREFEVAEGFLRARLYISSLGIYKAWLNGKKAGDEVLTPGFTDMDRRRQYQTIDVTDMIRHGMDLPVYGGDRHLPGRPRLKKISYPSLPGRENQPCRSCP